MIKQKKLHLAIQKSKLKTKSLYDKFGVPIVYIGYIQYKVNCNQEDKT